MSLHDLKEHIAVQEAAISKISLGLDSKTSWCAAWTDFRKSFWGVDPKTWEKLEPVVRDDKSNRIKDSHFRPDPPPTTQSVVTIPKNLPVVGLRSKRILVRSDYKEAEKAVVSLSKTFQAFVVGGQPGIGKSMFLLWLLMHRLALKLPTAFHFKSTYAILFHDGGVSEFTYLDDHPDYLSLRLKPSEQIWVLLDSGPPLSQPAPMFRSASPFFVVDATSPCSPHFGWLSKIGHVYFYMKPWSISEIIQARPYLGNNPHTERQLWHMHRKFGASLRFLIQFAADPQLYDCFLRRLIKAVDPDDLSKVLREPGFNNISHFIVTVLPSRTDRDDREVKIATRYIFELLWEEHIHHRTDLMHKFHDLFLSSPSTTIAVGWVFELRMHQLLRKQQRIRVSPIRGRRVKMNFIYDDYTSASNNPMELQLPNSTELDFVEKAELKKDHYYHPKSTNFPAIDSLLLIDPPGEPPPILLMFQLTRNKNGHDAKLRSLRKIDKLGLPSGTRRYYVVVTPKGINPKITIRASYFEEGQSKDTDEEDEDTDEEDEYTDEEDEYTDEEDEYMGEGEDQDMDTGEDEEMSQEPEVSPDDAILIFHYPVPLDELFVN